MFVVFSINLLETVLANTIEYQFFIFIYCEKLLLKWISYRSKTFIRMNKNLFNLSSKRNEKYKYKVQMENCVNRYCIF